ncbi:EAL and HDOD domain-containing protein [Duganella callida]|uniref:EAL and HDOD domain-containing protein n=1 Tax=Duganella callida TaxID=2561932 RepID=UPI001E51B829|nr:HDOD domain-containing protein [Duganella callida]
MGLLSFLKPKSEPAPADAVAPAVEAPPPAPEAPATAAGDPDAMVVRSEIVDAHLQLCGYRYSVPLGGDRQPLAEPVALASLAAAGVADFARQRLALVPLSADAVARQLYQPLVAAQTIFMVERSAADAVTALRAAGCRVALRGATLDDDALLSQAELVLLQLSQLPLAELQFLVTQLRRRHPALKLAIDGVQSWDEQRMCQAWGADYFLGPFLTTSDQPDPEGTIEQSRMTSIELLNLLRTDAELPAMIEVAKRDPGMTYQVLQWANAPGSGNTGKVTSLQQAFMVLGRNQLYRGLTVSMFRLGSGANRMRDESLLEVALTRARFLETCSTLPQAKRDELFLVGLLSLFDVLLGVPMARLADQMHLSDDIRHVLLGQDGVYKPYLTMVLLLERDKVEPALALAETLEVEIDSLAAIAQAAFRWAQDALR